MESLKPTPQGLKRTKKKGLDQRLEVEVVDTAWLFP
jgi:hypothetical protein